VLALQLDFVVVLCLLLIKTKNNFINLKPGLQLFSANRVKLFHSPSGTLGQIS
jgi:hypothetical protein